MSTQHYINKDEIIAITFWGGKERGRCLEFEVTEAVWNAIDDETIIRSDDTTFLLYKRDFLSHESSDATTVIFKNQIHGY